MPRRILFVVALVATLLAACGGTASAPALTDPKDILAHAATSLEGLKTVHVKASVTGKIDSGALSGGVGLPVDLTGSTLEGDIDVIDKEGKIAVAVPAVFGFSADAISTGGQTYIKTSLQPDGKYHKLDLGALTSGLPLPLPSLPTTVGSPDPSAVAAMVDQFKAQLDKLTIPPTKLADEKIGDQDCYHVQTKVSAADLPQASSALGTGSVTVDVWTRKSDYRPARLTIAVDAGTSGNLAITVDLTNYDAPVTITVPPSDQISDQPFAIPGLTP
jgi:hypothetical protein